MSNYIGVKCPVCGVEFKEDDDIVVCPICGTPSHRSCYKQNGECINKSYHEQGKEWESPIKDKIETVLCPKCNAVNPKGNYYCQVCNESLLQKPKNNMPNVISDRINKNIGEPVNFDDTVPKADIVKGTKAYTVNGIEVEDMHLYLGKNQLYFLSKFKQHEDDKMFASFNWSAFFLTFIYFFYRKMYRTGTVLLSILILCFIPIFLLTAKVMPQIFADPTLLTTLNIDFTGLENLQMMSIICSRIPIVVATVGGLLANYIYRNKCVRDIKNIREMKFPINKYKYYLFIKGGTSTFMATMIVIFVIFAYLLATKTIVGTSIIPPVM